MSLVEPLIPGLLAFTGLVLIVMFGIPIAWSLMIVASIAMFTVSGPDMVFGQLSSIAFGVGTSYTLAVLPLFILMGYFAGEAGVCEDLLGFARGWFGHVRGGLLVATTVSTGLFGACSGSTAGTSALFTRLVLPEMVALKYSKGVSAGCIAAGGTISALIPPSVAMAIYCMSADASLGRVMMAGILPGILTIVLYCIAILILIYYKPQITPADRDVFSWKRALVASKNTWSMLMLFFLLMGGIFLGWFTSTAAASVGAIGALLLALGRRKLSPKGFRQALFEAAVTSSSIFLIMIFGNLLGRFLALSGFMNGLQGVVNVLQPPQFMVLIGIVCMYLVFGCFLDGPSLIVVTTPFVVPLMTAMGYSVIFIGIIIVVLVELAVMTPPVGMNVFVVKAALPPGIDVPLWDIFKGIFPFVAANFVVLILLFSFPSIALWLPSMMIH